MCAAARCPQTPAPLNLLDYFFWHHSASPAAFLHLMELPLVLEIIQLTDVESCSCSPALQTPLLFGLLFLSIAELCKKTPSMHTCGNVLLVLGPTVEAQGAPERRAEALQQEQPPAHRCGWEGGRAEAAQCPAPSGIGVHPGSSCAPSPSADMGTAPVQPPTAAHCDPGS